MLKNILILIFGLYILVLFQTSLFADFRAFGFPPNFILVFVILFNFFESPAKKFGLISAIFGGFFLDVFSASFFGFHILFLLVCAVFIKFIVRRYVRIPGIQKY